MSFADKQLLQVSSLLWNHLVLFQQLLHGIEHLFFLLKLLDMKIFVDTDSDIRLVRRLRRDITERGRDIEGVIKQYNKFVKPAFERYIEPTMRLADIVVPRGETSRRPALLQYTQQYLLQYTQQCLLHYTQQYLLQYTQQYSLLSFSSSGGGNMVAIDLIVQHVHSQLEEVSEMTSLWRERRAPPCDPMM